MSSYDHHDWHSTAYVDEWVTRSQQEDAARLPRFQLMANLLPYPKDAPITVLDVGAGYGPLTGAILDAFPNARVVAQDCSEPMLGWAKKLLARHSHRVTFLRSDLFSKDWLKGCEGPYDAVVSAIALHNLQSAPRIQAIYGEIRRALRSGGGFLNMDLINAPTPALQRRYWEIMLARRARRTQQASGPVHGGTEELARGPEARHEQSEAEGPPFPASLDEQLAWLRGAGFSVVDCFWKELGLALVGGYT